MDFRKKKVVENFSSIDGQNSLKNKIGIFPCKCIGSMHLYIVARCHLFFHVLRLAEEQDEEKKKKNMAASILLVICRVSFTYCID